MAPDKIHAPRFHSLHDFIPVCAATIWNVFAPDAQMNNVLWEETKRILDTFGNHPSFLMLSPSNEPGGDWLMPLTDWVSKCRAYDSRHLYTIQSGWPYPMEPDKITTYYRVRYIF